MGFKQREAKNRFIYLFYSTIYNDYVIIITFLKTEYRLLGSFLIIQMIIKILGVRKIGNKTLLRYMTSTKVQQHRGEKSYRRLRVNKGNCLHFDVNLSGPKEPSRWLTNSNISTKTKEEVYSFIIQLFIIIIFIHLLFF